MYLLFWQAREEHVVSEALCVLIRPCVILITILTTSDKLYMEICDSRWKWRDGYARIHAYATKDSGWRQAHAGPTYASSYVRRHVHVAMRGCVSLFQGLNLHPSQTRMGTFSENARARKRLHMHYNRGTCE